MIFYSMIIQLLVGMAKHNRLPTVSCYVSRVPGGVVLQALDKPLPDRWAAIECFKGVLVVVG